MLEPEDKKEDKEDQDGYTPLMQAAQRGDISAIKTLLTQGAQINYQNQTLGSTALISAVKHDQNEALQELLANKADPNLANHYGNTPLIVAAIVGNLAATRILLASGSHSDSKNTEGYTPLFFAVIYGHCELTTILLQAGADPNLKNDEGMTPLFFAVIYGHCELINLLLQHGAKDPANQYGLTNLEYIQAHEIDLKSSEQKNDPHNFRQNHLIPKIETYIERNRAKNSNYYSKIHANDAVLLRDDWTKGLCLGLAGLFLATQSLSCTCAEYSTTIINDTAWMFATLAKISAWDGKAKLGPEEEQDFELIISLIISAQLFAYEKYLPLLEMTSGVEFYIPEKFDLMETNARIIQYLKYELPDNHPILVIGGKHATALFKRQGKILFYDANSPYGIATFNLQKESDLQILAKMLFSAHRSYALEFTALCLTLNHPNSDGLTPLMRAAKNGQIKTAQTILNTAKAHLPHELKLIFTARNRQDKCSLQIAHECNRPAIVKIIEDFYRELFFPASLFPACDFKEHKSNEPASDDHAELATHFFAHLKEPLAGHLTRSDINHLFYWQLAYEKSDLCDSTFISPVSVIEMWLRMEFCKAYEQECVLGKVFNTSFTSFFRSSFGGVTFSKVFNTSFFRSSFGGEIFRGNLPCILEIMLYIAKHPQGSAGRAMRALRWIEGVDTTALNKFLQQQNEPQTHLSPSPLLMP